MFPICSHPSEAASKITMSIEKRRFIRFSLDIPAYQFNKNDEPVKIMVRQISIGGCLAELDENILIGEEFRLEFTLPNKNRLPLYGKAVYHFGSKGVGVQFLNISRFEQELVGNIISEQIENEGLPLLVDPFLQPPEFFSRGSKNTSDNETEKFHQDELVDQVIASEV